MSAIKKFFEKRKLNVKFKKAGDGHRLTDDSSSTPSTSRGHANTSNASSRSSANPQSAEAEAAKRAAAQAALARVEAKQQSRTADGMVIQRARMKREMESEKKRIQEAEAQGAAARAGPTEVIQDCAPMLESVLFTCPDVGPMVLPKAEMEAAIHQFLLDNLEDEPEMTSALLIHTLNKNKEKVKICIDTLIKYIDNIINNPTEEKYWKIRQNNKAFQERVACMEGTSEFLFAAGFSLKSLPFENGEAMFYVFDNELAKDLERLHNMKDVLLQAEPLRPQLDRALKVFHPSQAASKFTVPDDFYAISPLELKKEQQRKEEATEKLGMLRTKAMRERDEQRELRKYRYTLLRIRFPDGMLLQGVFRAMESISHVYAFVRENLANDWIPFTLSTGTGHKLDENESALAELSLAPAAVINFAWDASVMKEVVAQQGQANANVHLKPEVMSLIQTL